MLSFTVFYLVCVNILTFLLYGLDKWKAIRQKSRISEKSLLISALIGGSIGAFCAIYTFRHKSIKRTFLVRFYAIAILQIIIIYLYNNHLQYLFQ